MPVLRYIQRLFDLHQWHHIGREYLKALLGAGYQVRLVGSTLGDLSDPFWDDVRAALPIITGPGKDDIEVPSLDGDWVNIVCGFGDDFGTWHMPGRLNIAITACHPRTPDEERIKAALRKYDAVIAPPQDTGLLAMCIPEIKVDTCKPKAETIKFVLERIFDEHRAKETAYRG